MYGILPYDVRTFAVHEVPAMTVKSERLEMRLPPELKDLLEQAAALSGQPLSAFIRFLLADRAQQIVDQHTHTRLSRRDQARFLAIIANEDEPAAALKAAVKRHKPRRD
jgi:uncharacterized protein (DUF1778 family)